LEILDLINPFNLKINKSLSDGFVVYTYLILLLIIVYNIIRYFLKKKIDPENTSNLYNQLKITRYILTILGIILLGPVFYSSIIYLPTILALTAAGLVISLKDITLNFVGWILIHGSSGFKVGDRLEIENVKGDVINIGIMKFTLLEVNKDESTDQSTNRLIHVPNHLTLIKNIHISTSQMDYLWDEIKISLPYSSNWQKAEEICNQILKDMFDINKIKENIEKKLLKISENYMLKLGKTSPIVYTILDGQRIQLSLRYLTRVHEKRTNRNAISKKILNEFKNHPDILL
jgi:small-conductance mechanosensitive channel